MDRLGYALFTCIFVINAARAKGQTPITLTSNLGESVSFTIPHSKDCHNYILYDSGNVSLLVVNKYGNNLKNWASDRAEFYDSGTFIIFTIKSVQLQDQGDFRFVSAQGNSDSECERTFHLQVTQRVDGAWTEWSDSGTCSKTCGTGIQLRTRSCTNPAPQYGGDYCSGNNREERTCRRITCPVHGNWGEWSVFTDCSVSCGTGIHTRWRECSNPFPAHGGNNCLGMSTERRTCTELPCPVHGGWSQWSEYGPCSVNCNTGIKVRTRTCSDPTPMHGGRDCVGSANESVICNSHRCRVDGGWSEWSQYGECSVSCNTGTKVRTRTCTKPVTAYGGRECVGKSTESVVCNDYLCPIAGVWSQWSEEPCSVSCGGGSQNRYRVCNNPGPAVGGTNCTGRDFDIRDCNEQLCPVHGSWSSWSNYSECSHTCGTGIRSRTRTCSEPRPQNGGKLCKGDNKQPQLCNETECAGPEASPVPQASQETPTAVFIGGGVAAFLVVIVAVVAVCYNKHKQRNTTQENRYNAGLEMRNMMPSQIDNPTYAEPEERESGVYWEIPSRTSCYPQKCEPQYDQLPEARANENENPYTKMDSNLDQMKKVHEQEASCRGSDYLQPVNVNRINANAIMHNKGNGKVFTKMSPHLNKFTKVHMQDSFSKVSDFLEPETQMQSDTSIGAVGHTNTYTNAYLDEPNKVHEQEEFGGSSDYLTPKAGKLKSISERREDNDNEYVETSGYITPTFVPPTTKASQ